MRLDPAILNNPVTNRSIFVMGKDKDAVRTILVFRNLYSIFSINSQETSSRLHAATPKLRYVMNWVRIIFYENNMTSILRVLIEDVRTSEIRDM